MKRILKYYYSCHEKTHSSFFAGNMCYSIYDSHFATNCPQILVCPGHEILLPMNNTATEYDTNSWDTSICIFWLYLVIIRLNIISFETKPCYLRYALMIYEIYLHLIKNIVASLNSIAIIQPSPLHVIQTRSFVWPQGLNTRSKLSNDSFKRNCIRQR